MNSPSGDAAGSEPKRKIPVRGPVKKEASGTFEKMLLESAQVPAADDTYVVLNVLFSLPYQSKSSHMLTRPKV